MKKTRETKAERSARIYRETQQLLAQAERDGIVRMQAGLIRHPDYRDWDCPATYNRVAVQ